MRSTDQNWVGPLIARGVTATFGNTSEPYLRFTHHFDQFFTALAQGWNFADAAYFALPTLSWQAVAIGDPLYRPFARPLEEMLHEHGPPEDILMNQYVAIRKANLLAKEEQPEEAIRFLQESMHKTPGPALALRLAQLLKSQGKVKEALAILSPFASMQPLSSSDWGLMAEMADTLLLMEDAPSAFLVYKRLEKVVSPEQVLLAFLRRGIQAAEEAGKPAIARDWQSRVYPPPPPQAEKSAPPEPEGKRVSENTD